MKDYKAIVSKLTLDEKIKLLNVVKMNTVPLPEHDIGTVQMSDATSSVPCPWKERIGGGGVTIDPASLDSPLDYIRQSAKENDIEVTYEPLYDMFSGSINMALRI